MGFRIDLHQKSKSYQIRTFNRIRSNNNQMYIFVETCFFSVMHGKQEITWDFFLRGSKQQDMFRKNYPFINSLCLACVVDVTKQTTVEPVHIRRGLEKIIHTFLLFSDMKSKLNFDTKNAFPLQFVYLVDVTVFIIIYPPAIDAHCLIIHGQVSKLNIQKQFCR